MSEESFLLFVVYILIFLTEFAVFALIPAIVAYLFGGGNVISFMCFLIGLVAYTSHHTD